MLKFKSLAPALAILLILSAEGSGPLSCGKACAFQIPTTAESSRSTSGAIQVELRSTTVCETNIVRLSDIAKLTGSPERIAELEWIPLAPSPIHGATQTWKKNDIEQVLSLRGIDVHSMRWTGSAQCYVERSIKSNRLAHLKVQLEGANKSTDLSSGPVKTQVLQSPDKANRTLEPSRPILNASNESNARINTTTHTPAFVSPGTISQAEHVVASLIESYLQTQTESEAAFYVEPKVAPEHAKILVQRRQITGVSGGISPYEGIQEFSIAVRDGDQETIIPISADVRLPELYLAAKSQLSKGHILRAEDLTYSVLPRSSKENGDAFAVRMDELIGKELKRSMSSRQMIRRSEVGVPKLVHVGDLIKIEVVLGGVVIETNGKALESGGADELIQVETIDHRKRLVARIRSERVVEVYSQGNSSVMKTSARHSFPSKSAR